MQEDPVVLLQSGQTFDRKSIEVNFQSLTIFEKCSKYVIT